MEDSRDMNDMIVGYTLRLHQTWLAGKSPTKIGSFNGNINYSINGGLSVAMFDFRVASTSI